MSIIKEGYLGEPGNPIFKHLKIKESYLEETWRPLLKERC
jgi:hypothetical protein